MSYDFEKNGGTLTEKDHTRLIFNEALAEAHTKMPGFNPNLIARSGGSLLHQIAFRLRNERGDPVKCEAMARLLVGKGLIDLTVVDKAGKTAEAFAEQYAKDSTVHVMLKTTRELIEACARGDVKAIPRLVEKAEVNALRNGGSALITAFATKQFAAAKVLLESAGNRIDPRIVTHIRITPIMDLCRIEQDDPNPAKAERLAIAKLMVAIDPTIIFDYFSPTMNVRDYMELGCQPFPEAIAYFESVAQGMRRKFESGDPSIANLLTSVGGGPLSSKKQPVLLQQGAIVPHPTGSGSPPRSVP